MKGAQGLIIAVFLGLLGVALNWIYLQNKVRDAVTVNFLGVKDGITIKPGETIDEEDLVSVPIPEHQARRLRDFVVLAEAINSVAGRPAIQPMLGGEFVYRHDLRTPPPELKLKEGEQLIWVTVDGGGFVPSLLDPGDQITFIIPTGERSGRPGAKQPVGTTVEQVGPFTIKTLGNRLGTREVMAASHIAQVQERDIGIIVKDEDAKSERLMELQGNRRNISIKLVEKAKKAE